MDTRMTVMNWRWLLMLGLILNLATPKEATPFLRERLRPAVAATAEQTRPLLADLDSDDFQKREAASAQLLELGD